MVAASRFLVITLVSVLGWTEPRGTAAERGGTPFESLAGDFGKHIF
jgi:hypothetical protein